MNVRDRINLHVEETVRHQHEDSEKLYCLPATSSQGRECFEIRSADVRFIGLPASLQNMHVCEILRERGYTAFLRPTDKENAVRVPLHMARALIKCKVENVMQIYKSMDEKACLSLEKKLKKEARRK